MTGMKNGPPSEGPFLASIAKRYLERETRFELATSTLARLRNLRVHAAYVVIHPPLTIINDQDVIYSYAPVCPTPRTNVSQPPAVALQKRTAHPKGQAVKVRPGRLGEAYAGRMYAIQLSGTPPDLPHRAVSLIWGFFRLIQDFA